MAACEGLAERSGLDNPLVGKLLVRWCDDAQSRRYLVASRRNAGCLGCKLSHVTTILGPIRGLALSRLLLESGLDDVSLLLADVDTALKLFFHHWVLCNKTGRQTSEADFLNTERVPTSRQACRLGTRSSQSTVLGEVQLARPVSHGGQVWGTGLLLDEDLGSSAA